MPAADQAPAPSQERVETKYPSRSAWEPVGPETYCEIFTRVFPPLETRAMSQMASAAFSSRYSLPRTFAKRKDCLPRRSERIACRRQPPLETFATPPAYSSASENPSCGASSSRQPLSGEGEQPVASPAALIAQVDEQKDFVLPSPVRSAPSMKKLLPIPWRR